METKTKKPRTSVSTTLPTRHNTPREDDGRIKLAKHVVTNKKGNVLKITDEASAEEYLSKFFRLAEDIEGRTKKYVTLNGFSNPAYVLSLPNQGLTKTALAAIKVLIDGAVRGDQDAISLLRVLANFLNTQPQKAADAIRKNMDETIRQFAEVN